jgi:tripartite-type tricarboxylate transporter receptor subunit TctC
MRRLLDVAVCAALFCGFALPASAQGLAERTIRLIIPYAPGGITDISARIFAPQMGEQIGQQVIVDNRPGGAAMIGFAAATRSPADGQTLVFATTALAANPVLFKDIPYDARKDFTPIVLIGVVPMVLVVSPSFPAKTVPELIALARSKPGELNYGTAGNGSDNHLTSELFNHLAGIKVAHVPYRGGGQVMTDLIAGRLSYVFATMPTAINFVKEGQLRALATTGQTRSAALPDVPTVAEAALPDLVLYAWLGLLGPAGIPAPTLERLNTAANATLKHPATVERLRGIGLEISGGTPQEMSAHLDRELNRWADLAKHVKFETSN